MALLGNILWLVLGGWAAFLAYSVAAVLFLPIFLPLFRLARYAAWPFGREVVAQSELDQYRKLTGGATERSEFQAGLKNVSGVLNVLWMLTFGWVIALGHLVLCIINVFFFWMVVTIPNIAGHWKLIPVAFRPFNRVIVPADLAKEVRLRIAKSNLNL